MLKRLYLFSLLPMVFSSLAYSSAPALSASGQHFNFTFQNDILTITTTTPHWRYPSAGIQLTTSGYLITGNTLSPGNGYFIFAVSDTQSISFTITGPAGDSNLRLCLNGTGDTYGCENYTVTVSEAPTVSSYSSKTGIGVGTSFVPGLGSAGTTTVHFYGLPLLSPGVCDTSITSSTYPGTPVTLTNTSLTSPPSFPDACVAFCNDAITSSTYPGASSDCTNVSLVTT
jgi:hypothetical protein